MTKFLILLLLLCTSGWAKNEEILLTEENSILFNKPVMDDYVSKKTLEALQKSQNTSVLYIILDTPGGSVTAGLAFVDNLKSLKIPVHTITLFAASMGYQFVQELGTRYITGSGTLMSHRGAIGGLSGQVPGELNSRLGHIQSILDGMSARAAARVGMSKKEYDAAIVNEIWVSGKDAVNLGHADAVANVRCDKKLLEETYEEEAATIFGSANLTFSKCPLISAPIKVSFAKEVKPEDAQKIKQVIESRKRFVNLTF